MMTWQPQDEPLRQLARYLNDSLSPKDKEAQKNAEMMLKNAKASPDFVNYLAYLFSSTKPPPSIDLSADSYHIARSAAAIMLKNSVKTSYKALPDPSKNFLRSVILSSLQDPNLQMRNYAGNVITELVKQGGIMGWPQLLPELIGLVENKGGNVPEQTQEGAMSALFKICEDNKRALDREYQGQKPLNFLFPRFLDFTKSPLPKVRATALASINVFLPEKSQAVRDNIDQTLLHLFNLAGDSSTEVRKYVCRSFTHVAEISPEKIVPHMGGIVDFTLMQQRDETDSELALDAAEFWLCIAEDESMYPTLGPFLPKIVPVLLESMVYSEDDILRLEGDADDADQEDREQDIKPVFATAKGARAGGAAANGEVSGNGANGPGPASTSEGDDLSEGEIEEYDDDDDDYELDPEDQWNLRKCSAAALDVLATHFHGQVFEVTLPYLKDHLNDPEWPQREASVLALGAIADGCMDVVQPHLPELTPYLLTLLQDKEPVVRQITCWTLGRYSSWAAHLDQAGRHAFFEPIMDGILKRMLDQNKRVQEAAASAFASLEEKARSQLMPYSQVIVRQFVDCFARYKDRNMFILYDCVQTLAEHVGPALRNPDQVALLMPALFNRWNKVADQSREMFPLLECLSYVATALGESFTPFAEPIFMRCIKIIHQNLEDAVRAQNNPAMDQPDKDFLVTSLDLLSAIIQALTPIKSVELVSKARPSLFELLAYCTKDTSNDVRQSAYALLGDCAIYVFEQLRPYLPSILEILIEQLEMNAVTYDAEETGYSVINNACWSVGEISMREKEGMAPYVERLLQKLATILFSQNIPQSLNENAAIALGRLGTGCPEALAPHLAAIAPQFLRAMHNVMWTDEKGHAFVGFNRIVLCNPQAMEKCLLDYFGEIASAPTPFLQPAGNLARQNSFLEVLKQYKNLIPNFDEFLHHLPPEKEHALRQNFNGF